MDVRVLLADDHRILRQGLRALLEAMPGIAVIGEAEDGRAAVKLSRETRPDVVIMDVGMPGLNGIEATRQIRAALPQVAVIALSMHADKRFILEMLKAGAAGYMLKDCAFEEMKDAFDAVLAKRAYLSPGITDTIVRDFILRLPEDARAASALLTTREREVLQLIAEGASTKLIAERLALSVKTIETYRKQIMDKLGLRSVAELTKYAIREGITDLDT